MISRSTMVQLREEIDVAIAKIGKKHKLDIKLGNGTYGETAKFKLHINPIVKGQIVSKEAIDFKKYAADYGLTSNMLGKTIIGSKGHKLKIIGLNTRAPKFCVQLEDVISGRTCKAPASYVKNLLKNK